MPRIAPEHGGTYRFDNIVVEPLAHRLERDGQPLSVEPKAYLLLLTLLCHAGKMVSKDELLDTVWGHHHVTTGVLNRVISQLRRTLGDSPEQPRYIATVHSLGYRFIGELQVTPPTVGGNADASFEAVLPNPPAPSPDTTVEAAHPPFRRRLTDGDPFLNYVDLQPCLNQLANWAALLPPGDRQRTALLMVLALEYARLRESGVTTPSLIYHEAVLAALQGDRQTALAKLGQAIDEGFRDQAGLHRDLAWRALVDDADFRRHFERFGAQQEATEPRPPDLPITC